MIYLDNNATTQLDPRVADLLDQAFRSPPANPSSQHGLGRAARDRIEQSLEVIGNCLGSRFDQPGGPRLILTSGGTESNNLALRGLVAGGNGGAGGNDPSRRGVLISRIEHPSVFAVAESLRAAGHSLFWLPVDRHGVVDLESLDELLGRNQGRIAVVSIMSANNETGVLQPVKRAAEMCRRAGVPLHVDATQSIGKVAVDLDALGAEAVTFTAGRSSS